jgi:hypothetical protein
MTRFILAGVVVAALLAPTASAAPTPVERGGSPWHHHTMDVPAEGVARWVSRARFAPVGYFETAIYVDGKEGRGNPDGCRFSVIDMQISVIADNCGAGAAPFRLRATSFDGRPHRVTLVYRSVVP